MERKQIINKRGWARAGSKIKLAKRMIWPSVMRPNGMSSCIGSGSSTHVSTRRALSDPAIDLMVVKWAGISWKERKETVRPVRFYSCIVHSLSQIFLFSPECIWKCLNIQQNFYIMLTSCYLKYNCNIRRRVDWFHFKTRYKKDRDNKTSHMILCNQIFDKFMPIIVKIV